MSEGKRTKAWPVAALLACALLAGGCSAGDVELNGSLFDKLGVGSNSQTANRNPQVAERQALVIPPDLERLPQPGSGAADSQSAEAFPVNPENKRVAAATQAKKDHAAYCEKALQKARAMRDQNIVMGPMGRCDGSILDNINVNSPIKVDASGEAPKNLPR